MFSAYLHERLLSSKLGPAVQKPKLPSFSCHAILLQFPLLYLAWLFLSLPSAGHKTTNGQSLHFAMLQNWVGLSEKKIKKQAKNKKQESSPFSWHSGLVAGDGMVIKLPAGSWGQYPPPVKPRYSMQRAYVVQEQCHPCFFFPLQPKPPPRMRNRETWCGGMSPFSSYVDATAAL